MRIGTLSDTHALHEYVQLKPCEVLIHAGDLMNHGKSITELTRFLDWYSKQNAEYLLVIAGNHDLLFEEHRVLARDIVKDYDNITYLENSGKTIEGIKFWGSPVTPEFYNWAFNSKRGFEINQYWRMIPDNTNVLITHGPPDGILDEAKDVTTGSIVHVGCADLMRRVESLKDLKLHVFGHIHRGYGHHEINGKHFINAAICNEQYKPVNAPIYVEI